MWSQVLPAESETASVSRLMQAGRRVFATVRKAADGDSLASELCADLTPVVIDVTDRAIISAAEQIFSKLHQQSLDGLVNVAGVGRVQPVEYVKFEDLQDIFNINVFGPIAVTQALLPLFRKAHGRIVNISAVGAHIAVPFGSLINASKSAFGVLSDTLRLELPFGIRVSTPSPFAAGTDITNFAHHRFVCCLRFVPASPTTDACNTPSGKCQSLWTAFSADGRTNRARA